MHWPGRATQRRRDDIRQERLREGRLWVDEADGGKEKRRDGEKERRRDGETDARPRAAVYGPDWQPVLRFHEYLELMRSGDRFAIRCRSCRHLLCPGDENYKRHTLMRVRDLEAFSGKQLPSGEPYRGVYQEFCCPGCGTLLEANVGESKPPGQRIGQIDELGAFKVSAFIDEYYLPRVSLGQIATLRELLGIPADLDGTVLHTREPVAGFDVGLPFCAPTGTAKITHDSTNAENTVIRILSPRR